MGYDGTDILQQAKGMADSRRLLVIHTLSTSPNQLKQYIANVSYILRPRCSRSSKPDLPALDITSHSPREADDQRVVASTSSLHVDCYPGLMHNVGCIASKF